MSEDYYPLEPIAVWNTLESYWSTRELDLFSTLPLPFLETWPTSGSMLDGQLFEHPMPEPPIDGNEFSLLRTPIASEAEGGPLHPEDAKAGGNSLKLGWQIMAMEGLIQPKRLNVPTPTASDSHWVRTDAVREGVKGNHNLSLPHWARLLPTPTTQDAKNNGAPSQMERNTLPLNAQVLRIGETTDKQYNDGNTPSDAPHPTQP